MSTASKYIKKTIQNEFKREKDENYNYKKLYTDRLIKYRRSKEAVTRLDKPTNIPRARELGYKAKQGFIVVLAKVRKGAGLIRRPVNGRRPKRMGVNKITRRISIQRIAELRAASKYPGLEVLNSYLIGEDGQQKYYEVILVDPNHPRIMQDKDINWICWPQNKGRVHKGVTSAGKKNRGLDKKGKGTEKNRPSIRSKNRKAK
ncbi:MAG TPA: 50S ribosomal protein L15e [Candidatus Diapherotrites archaeon]|jgi:large subunit ribosomal protein L15e|nr:50S ribosomal protein L15e [Candidatus Diapherotrites archaeon]